MGGWMSTTVMPFPATQKSLSPDTAIPCGPYGLILPTKPIASGAAGAVTAYTLSPGYALITKAWFPSTTRSSQDPSCSVEARIGAAGFETSTTFVATALMYAMLPMIASLEPPPKEEGGQVARSTGEP